MQTHPEVLAVRVDESLYFANTAYLEDELLSHVADHPEVRHLVLIMSAVNFIDASALKTLETLAERVSCPHKLGPENIYLSTYDAIKALTSGPKVRVA